jgi:hypothetical protein
MNSNEKIIWEPFEGPQSDFLASTAKRVLFGGALGPGKTDALMVDPLRDIKHPRFQALFLRRTYAELGECMERAHRLYPGFGMKWEHDGRKWRLPGGGFIEYGHCEHAPDWRRYLTKEYQRIYFDQLETFPKDAIENIWSRCRTTIPELPAQVKCTANPGGESHLFIKQKWADRCPVKKRGEQRYEKQFDLYWQPMESGGTFRDEFNITWEFHPAIVFDNPVLVKNDPDYVWTLLSYDQQKRDAWLWGKWDIPMGQFFKEFNPRVHTNHKLRKWPFTWRGLISIDWATSGVFFATVMLVDNVTADVWVVKEFWCEDESTQYKASKTKWLLDRYPQVEVLVVPRDMSKEIKDRDIDYKETMLKRFLDYLGVSITIAQADMKRYSRVTRWDVMRDALNWKVRPPWLRFIGEDCPKLCETIPAMVHLETNIDDINPLLFDHGCDSLAYGLEWIQSHWRKPMKVPVDAYDAPVKQRAQKRHWLLQ